MVSPSEKAYCCRGVELNVRSDGRGRVNYRPVKFESGLLPQTNGSCRVFNGEVDVLASVKGEMTSPTRDQPKCGRVEVNVSFWPCSVTLDRKQRREREAVLSKQIQRMFGGKNGFDLTHLCVIESKFCWLLHLDLVIVVNGGNLLDILSFAAYGALKDCRLPALSVLAAESLEDADFEINEDPLAAVTIPMEAMPLLVTVSQISKHFVVDATAHEEECCSCQMVIAVTAGRELCFADKLGDAALDRRSLLAVIPSAVKIAQELFKRFSGALETEREAWAEAKPTTQKLGLFGVAATLE